MERAHHASKLLDECLMYGPFNMTVLKTVLVRNGSRSRDPSGKRVHAPLHVHQRLIVQLAGVHGEP